MALVSARGSVERSAPPVRVHNLSKTWLRRLPGAAAGAATGPLDRLQGPGRMVRAALICHSECEQEKSSEECEQEKSSEECEQEKSSE